VSSLPGTNVIVPILLCGTLLLASKIPHKDWQSGYGVSQGRAFLSMVVVVPVLIPVVVVVPVMIVIKPATISIPVPRIKLLSIVVRFDPSSACIGRPRPVAFMPLVVVAGGKPITVYPREVRAWTSGHDANHAGARRRTNPDAKRNLSL
jgi:hypothetical protein